MPGLQLRARTAVAIWATVATLVVVAAGSASWLIVRTERDTLLETQERVARFASGAEAALNRTMIEL